MQEIGEVIHKTPARTPPLDEAHRGVWFEGADVVVALREYDGEWASELPRRGTFTLGASRDCDLSLPGRDLSATHCLFERKGDRLRLYDQHSTNGTFFGGRRVDVIDLFPGDTVTPAPVTLLAMSEEMRAHRPLIAGILGSDASPTPDQLLGDAVKSANHILITGEAGSDLDRLARAIHAVSLRRARELIEISELPAERAKQREILSRAKRSTLVIDLGAIDEPLDPAFCSMVFSPDYQVRVIALARGTNTARRLIPHEHLEQLQNIWIRPLAQRRGDIPELLDRIFEERGAAFRLADLSGPNRDALCAHEWRDNFNGLRLAADRLIAISCVPGWEDMDWREKSAALGMAKTTLYDWITGMGLAMPLFA